MKRPLTPQLLRCASVHVRYEIEQLSNSYTLLRNAEWWASIDAPAFMAQTAHNALVESFATHVRNLDTFLHEIPGTDDMGAGDWFPSGEWEVIRDPQQSDALRAARKRTNKEVAHLTYTRVAVGSPVWPHQEVVAHLRADLFRFIDRVDPLLVAEGFKAAAWQRCRGRTSIQARSCVGTVSSGRSRPQRSIRRNFRFRAKAAATTMGRSLPGYEAKG